MASCSGEGCVVLASGSDKNEEYAGDSEETEQESSDSGSEYIPETDVDSNEEELFTENRGTLLNSKGSENMPGIQTILVENTSSEVNASREENDNNSTEENGNNSSSNSGSTAEPVGKKLVRKRPRQPDQWAANVRKQKCQKGEEYVSRRGKVVQNKSVKSTKDCMASCKFDCAKHVTDTERKAVHQAYYSMTQNEKSHYIGKTTTRTLVCRPTVKGRNSRRKFSFKYEFPIADKVVRVCKAFYLGTLCISQKPIYNFHSKKNPVTNTPPLDKRGKHTKHCTSAERLKSVMDHINSFPRVESHYCRATTKKEYLESTLNVTKLYELYVVKCADDRIEPVKLSYYRMIFNTKFNLAFHIPKNDRCDVCEEYKMATKNGQVTEKLQETYDAHVSEKSKMRDERKADRDDKTKLVVCFDMENVITLPKCGTSNFYYRRKLNLYNMTAHASLKNKGYCAIWTEVVFGRTGNNLASAVVKILETVIADNPQATAITLWCDSCVPQNRNSHMSVALADFLRSNPQITSIIMKLSVPGHSCIQQVDNLHSVIEHAMETAEFFSPISFIRVLLKAKRFNKLRVIQMNKLFFKNYQACAASFNYAAVPYTKVTHLHFTQTYSEVSYKTSYADTDFKTVSIRLEKAPRRGAKTVQPLAQQLQLLPVPIADTKFQKLPKAKVDDLKAMKRWIPAEDWEYYESIFKNLTS